MRFKLLVFVLILLSPNGASSELSTSDSALAEKYVKEILTENNISSANRLRRLMFEDKAKGKSWDEWLSARHFASKSPGAIPHQIQFVNEIVSCYRVRADENEDQFELSIFNDNTFVIRKLKANTAILVGLGNFNVSAEKRIYMKGEIILFESPTAWSAEATYDAKTLKANIETRDQKLYALFIKTDDPKR